MSIATAIQNLTNTIRGIATTKGQIKSAVNTDFEAIQNEQIEQYPNLIRNAINQYKSYIPVVTGEGKQVSLNTVPLKPKEFALIGDTFQQQYEGKNLIPTQAEKWEQGAIATADGTNSDNSARVRTVGYYPIQELTDYYLSVEDTTYCFVNLFLYDSNKNYITNYYVITHSITGATSLAVNFPTNTAYYRAVMRNKTDSSAIIEPSVILTAKPMLALGTTKTDFEPYVGGTQAPNPEYPQEIKVVTGEQTVVKREKNLFNENSEWNINSSISVAGSTINKFPYSSGGNRYSYFFHCKPNTTYLISSTSPCDRLGIFEHYSEINPLNYTAENPVTLDNLIYAKSSDIPTTYTFTTGLNAKIVAIYYALNTLPEDFQIQELKLLPLNLGNIELCKIEDYKDILFKNKQGSKYYNAELDENSWYKKNVIDKTELTGQETMFKSAISGTVITSRFRIETGIARVSNKSYCNKFINRTGSMSAGDYECVLLANSDKIYISINIDRLTENTTDAFKTWLSNNGVIVYGALATPTYTKITDETLISQLEAINNTNMNDGTTVIYAENEEGLQPTLYVGAYKKEAV